MLDAALSILLLAVGSGVWAGLQATSPEGDPFDSPYYWWTWLLIALVAGVASYARPAWPRPAWWAGALVLPAVVALAVQGTILHDPEHGPSFWAVGELFIASEGLFAFTAATVGRSLAERRR